jgi:hypothetical protein
MYVCVCEREREREKERKKKRKRERERERNVYIHICIDNSKCIQIREDIFAYYINKKLFERYKLFIDYNFKFMFIN